MGSVRQRPRFFIAVLAGLSLAAAGCGTAARAPRAVPAALVLDGTLADPAAHRALLDRLRASGLDPVSRPFDPRLGEADLARYRVVLWLAGSVRGARGSLALEPEEVERAARFVEGGGRLALGVPTRDTAEGRVFRRILGRLGVPIEPRPHEIVDLDPAWSYPASLFPAALFEPEAAFAAAYGLPSRIVGERSAPLVVRPPARPLLFSGPRAFVGAIYGPPPKDPSAYGRHAVAAAARVGDKGGRVLVLPRALLATGGTQPSASADPLLPGRLPEGALAGRGRFLAAVLGELLSGLPLGDPGSTRPSSDPVGRARLARAAVCAPRPGEAWIDAEGVRAGWGYVDRPEAETRTLFARMPGAGLNAFWGPAEWWWGALADPEADPARTAAARRGLARVADGLGGTPVRWLAGLNVPGSDADLTPFPRAVTIGGRVVDVPSPVDPAYWEGVIVPRVTALASRAAEVPPLGGIVLDLEMYGRPVLSYTNAFDFGDGPFLAFLESAAMTRAGRSAARQLPAEARGDFLLETGRLPAYYTWLEGRAEALGRRLREAIDVAAPGRDLALGFYAVGILPSWYYRGLWRGASAGGRPVLLLTFQLDAAAEIEDAARRGACLYHAQAALLGLVGPDGLGDALERAAREHDGFWLNRVTHLVTSYPVPPHDAVEVPVGRSGDAAWAWVREATRRYAAARAGR